MACKHTRPTPSLSFASALSFHRRGSMLPWLLFFPFVRAKATGYSDLPVCPFRPAALLTASGARASGHCVAAAAAAAGWPVPCFPPSPPRSSWIPPHRPELPPVGTLSPTRPTRRGPVRCPAQAVRHRRITKKFIMAISNNHHTGGGHTTDPCRVCTSTAVPFRRGREFPLQAGRPPNQPRCVYRRL